MSYKVTINKKSYDLPSRTIEIDSMIESFTSQEKRYSSGESSRYDIIKEQYDFVCRCIPGILPEIDKVDTNDLLDICCSIVNVYNAPAIKVKTDAMVSNISDLLKRPEIVKAIEIVNAAADAKKNESL